MSRTLPRILLLGRNGQVGWELQRTLAPLGEVVALGRDDVDLAAPDQIRAAVRAHLPRVIVNAAAYTAVDRAESEPDAAFAINARAPGILAEEAARAGALFVHYSTDYVFDGSGTRPYTEEDEVGPRSVYGRSKLEGEQAVQAACEAHLVFRTSWVYGTRGANFLRTMLRLFAEREEVRVVADQHGAPTWSRMIAEATALVLGPACAGVAQRSGVYHLTAGGATTWHGFASAIHGAVAGGCATRVVTPIGTEDYPTPASRPAYSVLSTEKLRNELGVVLPDWEDSLALVLAEIGGAE